MKKLLLSLLIPCSIIFTWEIFRLFFSEESLFFPSTLSQVNYFFRHLPCLFSHAGVTLLEMLLGLFWASIFAFPLAFLMVLYPALSLVFQSYFVFVQCIPIFILAPIMVTMFGWSKTTILVPTVLMILFPLTLNIYRGLVSVPESLLQYYRFHGASRLQEFFKLRVPYGKSYLFAGYRISASVAGAGAIAGEWAGAQQGLGVFIQECRRNFDLEGVLCGTALLVIMSWLLYLVMGSLERRSEWQLEK